MAQNSDYNSLVNEKERTQNQKAACQRRIDDYCERLRVLNSKYTLVDELKDAYKENKKATKKIHKEDHDWKGSTYNSYSKNMEYVRDADDDYFDYDVKRVQDEINNEMTRLENLILEETGRLGKLLAHLNSLINMIENWVN